MRFEQVQRFILAKKNILGLGALLKAATLLGRLRQKSVLKCVPHVQHDYFPSFNQSYHCFLAFMSLPLPSSFLKFPISPFRSLGPSTLGMYMEY